MENGLEDLGKVPHVYGAGDCRTWRVWRNNQIIGTIRRSYPAKAFNAYATELSKGEPSNRAYFPNLKVAQGWIEREAI